jgi:hypothetical protein
MTKRQVSMTNEDWITQFVSGIWSLVIRLYARC